MTSTMQFFVVLLAAMTLTAVSTLAQHKYYARTVRRLATAHNEPGFVLVSGRGKSRFRGAIAVLVMRRADLSIRAAAVMEGASVLARFKDRHDWVGLPARSALPDCSPRLAAAVADACSRVPGAQAAPRRDVPVIAPGQGGGTAKTAD
jgi:glucitol operon activator protein